MIEQESKTNPKLWCLNHLFSILLIFGYVSFLDFFDFGYVLDTFGYLFMILDTFGINFRYFWIFFWIRMNSKYFWILLDTFGYYLRFWILMLFGYFYFWILLDTICFWILCIFGYFWILLDTHAPSGSGVCCQVTRFPK